MNDHLNEDVIDEAKNVNDDAVENIEIHADDYAKDEYEGHDDVVEDVVVLKRRMLNLLRMMPM